MTDQRQQRVDEREQLLLYYLSIRERSVSVCAPLAIEDYVIQTMPDVSPPKWHLAHTSWFFETFLLSAYDKKYKVYHPLFDTLFNSYYVTHGNPYPRARRGLLSRPTVEEVLAYRRHVDEAMLQLIQNVSEQNWQSLSALIVLGINHEQQHQELLLTDIKHIFAGNPLKPVYKEINTKPGVVTSSKALDWQMIDGGVVEVGLSENTSELTDAYAFSYDNEGPAHRVYLDNFRLASRCVSNEEYLAFIDDGGYQRPELWLSDGWSYSQQHQWSAPLYWQKHGDSWMEFTLEGLRPLALHSPVCHVSYFEADAYATWSGRRLPTEFEWEHAAASLTQAQIRDGANLFESHRYKPLAAKETLPLNQMFGDVWEWTASPYLAYPGYRPAAGAIGEYNGKFMSSQMVLRGGSFATAESHIRSTYRNFFYPKDRWQFSGIRLADEL